ncbi:glycolipid transfer protein 1-like [Andrographis paniculata]|uniref:glycolipid transfer protein 1-like n=1 Tax=Andrographis paniculata TaxID=175694 RepID=UPI0021E984F0|nr:glycolipid transfer protein 1-like [Andrographis paniculata]XP_051125203.1 glycolipid transfer protein 1-like [Andrographis paniculata]
MATANKETRTVFVPCLEGLKLVRTQQTDGRGDFQTKPFLDVCKHILPLLDKFGAAMTIVKADIGGNISRLESKYDTDPTRFKLLYSLVKAEVEANTAKGSSSCTNGLLWLTRAMDFLVQLFRNLCEHQDWSMSQCCNDAYATTLKKWHGWLASSSFSVAMKLVPDRNKFLEVLGPEENVFQDMNKLCAEFSPVLAEIHNYLASSGLDEMKCS